MVNRLSPKLFRDTLAVGFCPDYCEILSDRDKNQFRRCAAGTNSTKQKGNSKRMSGPLNPDPNRWAATAGSHCLLQTCQKLVWKVMPLIATRSVEMSITSEPLIGSLTLHFRCVKWGLHDQIKAHRIDLAQTNLIYSERKGWSVPIDGKASNKSDETWHINNKLLA